MDSNEKYYSFKKNPQRELVVGFVIISIILSTCCVIYHYLDKFFFDKRDNIMPISNPNDYATVKLFNGVMIFLCLIVIAFFFWGLCEGLRIFFQRERVILAKITRIASEQILFNSIVNNNEIQSSCSEQTHAVAVHPLQ